MEQTALETAHVHPRPCGVGPGLRAKFLPHQTPDVVAPFWVFKFRVHHGFSGFELEPVPTASPDAGGRNHNAMPSGLFLSIMKNRVLFAIQILKLRDGGVAPAHLLHVFLSLAPVHVGRKLEGPQRARGGFLDVFRDANMIAFGREQLPVNVLALRRVFRVVLADTAGIVDPATIARELTVGAVALHAAAARAGTDALALHGPRAELDLRFVNRFRDANVIAGRRELVDVDRLTLQRVFRVVAAGLL